MHGWDAVRGPDVKCRDALWGRRTVELGGRSAAGRPSPDFPDRGKMAGRCCKARGARQHRCLPRRFRRRRPHRRPPPGIAQVEAPRNRSKSARFRHGSTLWSHRGGFRASAGQSMTVPCRVPGPAGGTQVSQGPCGRLRRLWGLDTPVCPAERDIAWWPLRHRRLARQACARSSGGDWSGVSGGEAAGGMLDADALRSAETGVRSVRRPWIWRQCSGAASAVAGIDRSFPGTSGEAMGESVSAP